MKITFGIISLCIFVGMFSLLTEYLTYFRPIRNAMPVPEDFFDYVDVIRVVVQGVCLIVGLLSGFLFEKFRELELKRITKIEIRKELQKMFRSPQFYVALAAAPIVYTLVIVSAKGAPIVLSGVFALQNGFFWKAIFPTNTARINV